MSSMLFPWLLAVVSVSAAALSESRPSRYYNLLQAPEPQWASNVLETPLVKKYDRNCFFSPVQCMMLNYPTSNPIVVGYYSRS